MRDFEQRYIEAFAWLGSFARDEDEGSTVVVGGASDCNPELGRGGVFPGTVNGRHSGDGTAEGEEKLFGHVRWLAGYNLHGGQGTSQPFIVVRTTVCRPDPVLHGVVPPGSTERVLILEETANALDESLNFALNWILVLVSWGGWAQGNAMKRAQAVTGCRGVLGGACVAAKVANPMAMLFVECDNMFCGLKECGRRFVFDEDGMTIAAEEVFEEEKARMSSNGGGIDKTLIIDTDGFGGKEAVNSRAKSSWISIAFCHGTGGAMDM
jgi:hypothetical protein